MSVLPVALTWGGAGVLAALALPRLRRRRLAALVPLAAAVAALLTLDGGADLVAASAPGGLMLGRPAGGLILVCALAAAVCLLLSPPPDSGGVLTLAGCGALSAVALASGSPLTWGVCFVAGFALLGMRLVAAAPSRVTLAGARVATLGAAALAAAAPFLPVDLASARPRAHLAGGLLAGGIAAGFALVPVGGWMTGTARLARGGAVLAPWALLLLPALLLSAQPLQAILPSEARSVFGFILLPAGALTAVWAGLRGIFAADGERYTRALLTDLGLVAMGLSTPQAGARLGSLLVILTHLCVGPLLLQDPTSAAARPRRLAWLALSGIPPSPAFWGRFSLLTALTAGFGGGPLLVSVPAGGAVLIIALRAALAAKPVAAGNVPTLAARLAAWVPPLAAVTVGLVPNGALRALLGVG
jgi:hypothetical protein